MSAVRRAGFTIVEMMVVVAIVGILLGIVTTAASSSIKQARGRKADACRMLVQQAVATFYAQKGRWPGSVGSKIESGVQGNKKGTRGEVYTLSADEVRSAMLEILKEVKSGNPLMDISGLYVSASKNEPNHKPCGDWENGDQLETYWPAKGAYGLDFWDAVHGRRKDSNARMTTSQMSFGYPHSDGGFMPFEFDYYISSDEMKVTKWHYCGK